MQFSTALPCMLRGPASVWLWWDVWAEFWVGWQRWRRADYEDVDKFQRRRRRWRRWRRRTSDERWRGALGRCLLTLSHTHTHTGRATHTHTYTDSLSHRRPSSCCAYFKHTHTQTGDNPFGSPTRSTCSSLSTPPPTPVVVCIVENGFIENVVCFSIWFCSAAFSSSSSFFLSRFCFILYFYTIKYTWRGVSVSVCKCVHAFRRRVLCFPVPFLSFFLWLCLHFGVSASFWLLWTFSVFNFYVVHEL